MPASKPSTTIRPRVPADTSVGKGVQFAPAVAALVVSVAAALRVVAAGWWPHGLGYFVLTTGLIVGFSGIFGGLGHRFGLELPALLALWCAGVLLLSAGEWVWRLEGPTRALLSAGLPALAVYLVLRVSSTEPARRFPWPAVLSVAAGIHALAVLYPGLTASLPWLRAAWLEAGLGPALALGLLVGLALLAFRFHLGLGCFLVAGVLLGPVVMAWQQAGERPENRVAELPRRRVVEPLPSILVVVLDTVRADRLSLDGSPRPTSEGLEAFVRRQPRATVYPRAYAPSNWTVPSHASLLTGRLPSDHGAHFDPPSEDGATDLGALSGRFALRKQIPTLAAGLRDRGYRTIGVTANPWLVWTTGLRRGFDVFYRPSIVVPGWGAAETLRRWLVSGVHPEANTAHPPARVVTRETLRWLDACGEAPCFVLANLLEAHALYAPEAPCRGRFRPWSWREPVVQPELRLGEETLGRLSDRYDEELCNLDQVLVELLDQLEERGFFERGWLVITSDHGEAFGEHGVTEHSTSVYDEEVRVPLVVVPPPGVELPDPHKVVSLLDVAATLAAVAGIDLEGPGRDLRQSTEAAGLAPIEFFGDPGKARFAGALAAEPARAVVVGNHKLIEHAGRLELYHLPNDPGERHDLAANHPEVVEALLPLLPPLTATDDPTETEELTPEQQDALRALGYL